MLIQNDSFAHYCALLITSPSFFVFAITVKQSDFKITLCEDGNGDRQKCEILIQAVVLAHYCRFLILTWFVLYSKITLPLLYLAGQKKARTTKFSGQTRTLPVNLTGDHSRHLELEGIYWGSDFVVFPNQVPNGLRCGKRLGRNESMNEYNMI